MIFYADITDPNAFSDVLTFIFIPADGAARFPEITPENVWLLTAFNGVVRLEHPSVTPM